MAKMAKMAKMAESKPDFVIEDKNTVKPIVWQSTCKIGRNNKINIES